MKVINEMPLLLYWRDKVLASVASFYWWFGIMVIVPGLEIRYPKTVLK